MFPLISYPLYMYYEGSESKDYILLLWIPFHFWHSSAHIIPDKETRNCVLQPFPPLLGACFWDGYDT